MTDDLGFSVEIRAQLDRFERQMRDAGRLVDTTSTQMDKSTKRAAQQFGRLEAALDPVARATQRYERDVRRVESAVAKGAVTDSRALAVLKQLEAQYQRATQGANQYAGGVRRATAASASFDRSAATATRTSGLMGNAVQQAGFQIGDFATQVASGQGVLRPFIQQGTQLVSMFGPWGAVIGAAGAVVGALAVALTDANGAAEETERRFESAAEAAKAFADDTLLAENGLKQIAERFRELNAEAQRFEIRKLALQVDAAQSAAGEAFQSLSKSVQGALGEVGFAIAETGETSEKFRAELGSTAKMMLAAANDGEAFKERMLDLAEAYQAVGQTEIAAEIASLTAEFDNQQEAAERAQKTLDLLTGSSEDLDKAVKDLEKDTKDAEKAARDFDKAVESLTDRLNPAMKAAREYQEDQETLGAAFHQGRLDLDEYTRALQRLRREFEAAVSTSASDMDPLTGGLRDSLARAGDRASKVYVEAEQERLKASRDADEERRRAFEKHQEEIAKVANRTVDGIVDYGADAFEGWFTGQRRGWEAFAEDVKSIMFRTFAQIAANAVIRPIVAPIVGGVVSGLAGGGLSGAGLGVSGGGVIGPSGGGIGAGNLLSLGGQALNLSGVTQPIMSAIDGVGLSLGFGGGSAGAALSGSAVTSGFGLAGPAGGFGGTAAASGASVGALTSASLSAVLGAAGIGALGGGLLATVTGGNAVGGSVGGGLGAGIGFAVGGPIGALIGGAAGGLFGGMFGGGQSVGPNGHANLDIVNGVLRVTGAAADNGGNPAGVIAEARRAADFINNFAQSQGIQLGRPGATVQASPGAISFGKAGGPQSAEDFVTQFFQNSQHNFQQAPADIRGVINRSAQGGTDQLAQDLQFFQAYQDADSIGMGPETTPQIVANTRALAEGFTDARQRAQRLGLDTGTLDQAANRSFNRILDQALGIAPEQADPLTQALENLSEAFEVARENADVLGLSIAELNERQAEAEELTRERFRRGFEVAALQQSFGVASTVRDFLERQAVGDASSLSLTDRLAEARRQFDATLADVQGGDLSAVGSLTNRADTLLGIGRDVFASSPQFAALESFVRDQLAGIGQTVTSDNFVADQITSAIQAQTEASLSSEEQTREAIAELRREIRQLGVELGELVN